VMWEEAFRHGLHAVAMQAPDSGLVYAEVSFWIGREFAWWWLVAGLAAIVLTYLLRLLLSNEDIVRLGRGRALDRD
jgi:hypothetical protein